VLAIQVYLLFFSVVIIALEVKSMLCHKFLVEAIEKYAACLTTLHGRGIFYLLVGGLSIGQWRVSTTTSDDEMPGSGFWENLNAYFSWASSTGWLNAIAGAWLIFVAIVLLIVGGSAAFKMRKLAASLVRTQAICGCLCFLRLFLRDCLWLQADEPSVRKAFAEVDTNDDGQLDLGELSCLLTKLTGRAPGHAELELDLRELDKDLSGTVSVEELVRIFDRFSSRFAHSDLISIPSVTLWVCCLVDF